ncbi:MULTISPECIES: DUF3732 domain-containing protein [Nocardiopsis]|uniref:DUF3732 domain-containing protein n=1 Tax=Nocardiopsis TaxID=2013 RepID=UPI0034589CA2
MSSTRPRLVITKRGTHQSLHSSRRQTSCPVPRFLILDQPSQVCFPEDSPDNVALAGPTEPLCSTSTRRSSEPSKPSTGTSR